MMPFPFMPITLGPFPGALFSLSPFFPLSQNKNNNKNIGTTLDATPPFPERAKSGKFK
jgi:hypothetical protein